MATTPPLDDEEDDELDPNEAEPDDDTDETDDGELPDVEDTPDGGAIVRLDDEETAPEDSEFYTNLADEIDEPKLDRIATELLELIDRDKEARSKRDEQYEEGIRRTGLGEDAPGGAQFQGASKVVHPMLVEACVDFAARAMKELWPASGPCKTKIEGEETEESLDKAERKADLMNWQLTVQAQEARAELEQLLTQVPLGGAQYLKLGWDEKRNRPTFLAVMIDDVLLPFAATNFYSSQRKTHRQYITQQEYESRVRSGMYRDVDLTAPGMTVEQSKSATASDKVEGKSETTYNEDGLRCVYETAVMSDLEADEDDGDDEIGEDPKPYLITIDKETHKVLSIYRNWEEEDQTSEELLWMVEYPFIPWRGAYPIGLPHMIGGLAGAATGALRALLDSAHIQNTPSGMKLKGGTRGGQSLVAQPTEILEVEGGLNVDDIRKLFMPMPFNPPSTVLFQLLGFLTDSGKGVVRTSLDDLPDATAQQPVGTTLAKIEQGLVVFSAIHGRLHDAMQRMLRILHRFNARYLNEKDLKREVGLLATRKDFNGPMDVVPVSDPNIYSEAQRFAQAQAVEQRAAAAPDLYNRRKVEERVLQTLKVPNYDELLVAELDATPQNAPAENVGAALGKAIVAFPDQDHMAHLEAHLTFMMNPMLGSGPMFVDKFMPAIVTHLAEHVALWYLQATLDLASEVAGFDIKKASKKHKNPEDNKALDRLLSKAAGVVSEKAGDVFSELPPIIAQAQQMIQSKQQPPPIDPAQAAIQVAQANNQTKLQIEQGKGQQKQADAQTELQTEQAKGQMDLQLKQAAGQQDAQLRAQEAQAEQERAMQQMQLDAQAQEEQAQRDAEIQAQQDEMALQAKAREDALTATAADAHQRDADAQAELDRESKERMDKADNETRIEVAEIAAGAKVDAAKAAPKPTPAAPAKPKP